jgi:thiamine-phosphate pyrophosphorylase
LSGLTHAEQARRLIAGGARIVQLRDKHSSTREFYDSALAVVAEAKHHQVPVIINDRVDIALLTGAAGVHLGQTDMDSVAARRILGDAAVIGFSTHTLSQAKAASSLPIDYIAVGPVFPTSTKEEPDDVVGLEELTAIREVAGDLPIVAIGGIGPQNIGSVLSAGADTAAVISVLLSDPANIESRFQQLVELTR